MINKKKTTLLFIMNAENFTSISHLVVDSKKKLKKQNKNKKS